MACRSCKYHTRTPAANHFCATDKSEHMTPITPLSSILHNNFSRVTYDGRLCLMLNFVALKKEHPAFCLAIMQANSLARSIAVSGGHAEDCERSLLADNESSEICEYHRHHHLRDSLNCSAHSI